MIVFPNLNSDVGLKSLDEHLRTRYYISNFKATKDDITVYAALSKPPTPQYVNVLRWYNQIQTLLSISGISCQGNGVTITEVASVEKERTLPCWESCVMIIMPNSNEIDMKKLDEYVRSFQMEGMFWGPSKLVSFGYEVNVLRIIYTMYDDEEDEEVDNQETLCDHVYDYAKGFISIENFGLREYLMLIKLNDETDMEKVEKTVRSIQNERLYWGASKLVPVGYGINLLGIECIRLPRTDLNTIIKKEIMVNQYVETCQAIKLNRKICSGITYEESDSKCIVADDDDHDTEEEKKIASSPGKSRLMFLIKAVGNRDIKKVEENLRSIEKEGVVWGASKLVNVGYGCKYLRIIVTVEDKVFPDSKFDRNICAQTIVREKEALGYDVVVSRIITLNKTYDGENSRGKALM